MTDRHGRTVGLALSGGGARGAFEAGVISQLEEEGLDVDVVAGTSAGALNAAAVASGLGADAVVELWTSMESGDVYRPRTDVHRLVRPTSLLDPAGWLAAWQDGGTVTDQLLDTIGWSWLLDTAPLRERLYRTLGETLELTSACALSVPAVDLATGRLVRFTNLEPREVRDSENTVVGPITVDHLLASAAIPLLFRPQEIDGRHYWDGGLVANTPLRAALQHEPDFCVVVATGAVTARDQGTPTLGAAMTLVIDHVLRHALLEDLDHARTVNRLVEAAPEATKHRIVEFVLIAPEEETREGSGIGGLLDFDPARARRQVEAGRRRAQETLEAWRRGDVVDGSGQD